MTRVRTGVAITLTNHTPLPVVIYPVDFKTSGHIVDDVRTSSRFTRAQLMCPYRSSCTRSWSNPSPQGAG